MQTNIGTLDRLLRTLVGLGVVGWGVTTGSLWGMLGLVPLLTAAVGWCPAYLPLGINTCKHKPSA
ncbi:MAG: hypothetical protein B0D96_00545 [Candidatus Sedimenticola endophacoides]|uniref:DUF2892 domain-containing protein n=1 Tax=Candidatus Sedimenticola endophacoides TaxID=2548426 RepID=A0A6N4DWP7_9GAMM|nr:MAG: hypothetical protein B0D94_12115 [Candidatus Sedimenticola endophacoides]OQX38238.1 MAG: hypothetical protein B0D96_00545 [Candidatus Sedimenticola endophacoides]OQX38663.1 MAG: hypothetical protein B0D89_12305 [Candidatus Sedimenticola endophacoides]OQX49406.1 MAG: hypothetical protein B0D87_00520 [Candidatus Sedimenticola endophacoides]PUE01475.1 MAG: DUF2892 domain-containing protein [Candidatus Sedimenticola endophacoides]